MKEGNELTWPQVVMAANAPVMTKAALVDGRTDVGVLPTGQVVGLIEALPPWPTSSAASWPKPTAVLRGGPDNRSPGRRAPLRDFRACQRSCSDRPH